MITIVQKDPFEAIALLDDASIHACITQAPPLEPGDDLGGYLDYVTEVFENMRRVLRADAQVRLTISDVAAPPIPVVVELTPEELSWLSDIAHGRNDPKMAAGVPNHKIDPNKKDFDIHYMGIKAEYAVAKYLGLDLDTTFSLHGDNHRGDLTYHDGRTISVKFRTQRGWDFALTRDRIAEFRADLGVLVWPAAGRAARGGGESLEIVGYTTRDAFARDAIIRDFKYGPRLVLEARHFSPLSELLEAPASLLGLPFLVSHCLQAEGWQLTGYSMPGEHTITFEFGTRLPLSVDSYVLDPFGGFTTIRREYGTRLNYIQIEPEPDKVSLMHERLLALGKEVEIIS